MTGLDELEGLLARRVMRSTVLCRELGIQTTTAQRYRSRPDKAPAGFPTRWVRFAGEVWYDRAEAQAYIDATRTAKKQRMAQRGDTEKT